MATERYIHGKRDACHHEGKRSELRRIAEADNNLLEYLQGSDGEVKVRNSAELETSVQLAPDPQTDTERDS